MADNSQRFPATVRLKKPSEFDTVFTRRSSAGNGWLVVYAARNDAQQARIGLVVSKKKIGNAVQRNRWKRRLREAFRLNRQKLPFGFDLVVLPQSKQHPSFAALESGLVQLAHRAARKWKRNHASTDKPAPGNDQR
ncbi:ribonuclease P protein component [Bremerella cremea]|uniref:Ribonuclease P protein component n=1 Tax=Bremerella cremea TaxID=1031537 RepID=A0A368KQM4_9BACT|nr:ribonuclease P protein component [Bremerella cremea]RCS44732.1 ribonuclease P protein component [Bremerella cremea]